ncbi:hypothetical protein [Oscillibacter sp.]|uniref:hypothetical protein n=1 Tax=Oscillibacter sp. TaxID=1945593 RepID=UPI0028A0148F|nr:hypothetical protein [Oscillibacter sp.]
MATSKTLTYKIYGSRYVMCFEREEYGTPEAEISVEIPQHPEGIEEFVEQLHGIVDDISTHLKEAT